MNKIRENYLKKANNLYSRLLGEAPEDEEVTDTPEATDEANPEETEEENPLEEEQGQAEQVEIFFDSLDEETQKVLLNALRENLNIAEDDDFGNEKLMDVLAKQPIISIRAEELVRKLNIDI